MLSSRSQGTPRLIGSVSGGTSKGRSASRTAAELLELPDRQAGGTRPLLGTASSAVATLLPRGLSAYPTWSDANLHFAVQQGVQECIQPQLDRLAEQLAMLTGSAQSELREMERLMERWEVRAEGRFSGLESRLAVLADGAARSEQRERDLNERIAGIAGDFLRCSSGAATGEAEAAAAFASAAPRLQDLEQRAREANTRLDQVEDAVRKQTKMVRRSEERAEELEAHSRRKGSEQLQQQIEELWQHVNEERHLAAREEQLERLEHLEEQVCALSMAAASQDRSAQVASLASQVEEQRSDLKVLIGAVAEHQKQVDELCKRQEERPPPAQASEQQTLAARLDDINLRVGSLKVKTDSLEGRMGTVGERVEALRRPEEAFQRQLERCNAFAEEAREHIKDVERRVDTLSEDCEEVVEQALERRLAILAGAQPASSRGGSRSSRRGHGPALQKSHTPGLGTPSRPLACGDLKESDEGPSSE